jgi:hypothetical protein
MSPARHGQQMSEGDAGRRLRLIPMHTTSRCQKRSTSGFRRMLFTFLFCFSFTFFSVSLLDSSTKNSARRPEKKEQSKKIRTSTQKIEMPYYLLYPHTRDHHETFMTTSPATRRLGRDPPGRTHGCRCHRATYCAPHPTAVTSALPRSRRPRGQARGAKPSLGKPTRAP